MDADQLGGVGKLEGVPAGSGREVPRGTPAIVGVAPDECQVTPKHRDAVPRGAKADSDLPRCAKRGANDGARFLDAHGRGLHAALVLQVPTVGTAAAVPATEVNGARFARDLEVVASGEIAGDPLQHESTRLLLCSG